MSSIPGHIQKSQKFHIEAYRKPKDWKRLSKTHVPYSGSLQKHPYDKQRIILIADPFSTGTFYYEFRTKDIEYIEELPSMVNIDGETTSMVRVWIKKKAVGIRCTPFIVEDLNLH